VLNGRENDTRSSRPLCGTRSHAGWAPILGRPKDRVGKATKRLRFACCIGQLPACLPVKNITYSSPFSMGAASREGGGLTYLLYQITFLSLHYRMTLPCFCVQCLFPGACQSPLSRRRIALEGESPSCCGAGAGGPDHGSRANGTMSGERRRRNLAVNPEARGTRDTFSGTTSVQRQGIHGGTDDRYRDKGEANPVGRRTTTRGPGRRQESASRDRHCPLSYI